MRFLLITPPDYIYCIHMYLFILKLDFFPNPLFSVCTQMAVGTGEHDLHRFIVTPIHTPYCPHIRRQTLPLKQKSNVLFVTWLYAATNGAFKLYRMSDLRGNILIRTNLLKLLFLFNKYFVALQFMYKCSNKTYFA